MKQRDRVLLTGLLLTPAVQTLAATSATAQPQAPTPTNIDLLMLIAYVLLALVFSFLCSIAEAVLLSMTPSYIEGLKESRPRQAKLLKKLKLDNVDRSLAAILTLNTIAHTVGAIGAGAKAAVVFGNAWFGLFSGVMTLMILFLSEIVPKTIGAVYWSRLAGLTALFVETLILVLYPIVWFSERITQFISHGKQLHVFSREELLAMTTAGVETGQIHSRESRIIQNLLRLESLKVADIMTPRTVVAALPEDMLISESLPTISKTPFSRLPLYKGHIDNTTGFVLKNDVLIYTTQNRDDEPLKTLKREVIAVLETDSLTALFERLLKDRQHIAVVVDEYGGMEGLVTLEDLIETIMGMEIVDESDNVEDMRLLARKKWLERVKAMGLDADILEKGKKAD